MNTFWLILVTMTTSKLKILNIIILYIVGYGDIYPTTYFGRLLAVVACILGTFVISLLVVFLNSKISFDEVESHIYNSVMEEKTNDDELKLIAGKLLFRGFLYNYLHQKRNKQTKLYRMYLTIDMAYKAKEFKLFRMNHKKPEPDINEILGKIKYNFDNTVVPLRQSMEVYNRERLLTDQSHNYLKDSTTYCESLVKQSTQIINLLKVLNNGNFLDGLKDIDQVYDNQATITEEIVKYHNLKYIDKINLNTEITDTEISLQSSYNTLSTP